MRALRYLKEVEWPRAYREQDTVLLDRILGDDFQMVAANGDWSDKAGQMARIQAVPMDHDFFRYRIKRLEVFENGTAIVGGTGTIINDSMKTTYQSTNILIKREGTWKAVSSHVSGINNSKCIPMKTLRFSIEINAPVERVYQTMLDNDSFRKWTAAFSPTSFFEGNWEVGTTMRFLSTDEAGNRVGLLSRVKENVPNKYVSLEHYGWIQGDQDITEGPEIDAMKGALENYTFIAKDGYTAVKVDSDTFVAYESMFLEAWPKALETLKTLCETE